MQYRRAARRKAKHEYKAELKHYAGLTCATASRLPTTCDDKQVEVMLHG